MDVLITVVLLSLAGAAFGVLGYLLALNRVNTERGQWRDSHNHLQTALKLAEEQRGQARAQCGEIRAERDAARAVLSEREAAWGEQTARLQSSTESLGQVNTDLKTAQERLQRAESDLQLLTESLETSRRQLYERNSELERAGRVESGLRAVITEKEQTLNEHKTNLERLRTERATLEKQQAEVAAAKKQLDQLREEHSHLQAKQIEATVNKILTTSQEKLATTADDKLGSATRSVTEKLRELEQHIREFDTKRTSTETRLDEQIKQLTEESVRSRQQTEALVGALRRPQVRGQWGEMHLKRAVEMANMREHCDFDLQVQVNGDDGILRPDMVVHLTSGRNIVVDAKVSLAAFLSALEATDDAERDRLMVEHARQVRKHVDTLAAKEYFEKVAGSPDFVLMFLPNEALLQAALDKDPKLYEHAFAKRIIIASPTVLIPMLRTIEIAWTEAALQENMRQVHKLGQDIHSRLGTLGGHLQKLGRSLDGSVRAYNATIGSLEGNVLPAARRFKDLKILSNDLAPLEPVDSTTRTPRAPELMAAATAETRIGTLTVDDKGVR